MLMRTESEGTHRNRNLDSTTEGFLNTFVLSPLFFPSAFPIDEALTGLPKGA